MYARNPKKHFSFKIKIKNSNQAFAGLEFFFTTILYITKNILAHNTNLDNILLSLLIILFRVYIDIFLIYRFAHQDKYIFSSIN